MENKNFTPEVSGYKAILDAYAYRAMPNIDKEKSANELAEQIRNSKDSYVDKAVDIVLVYSNGDISTQQDMVSQSGWKMYTLMDMVRKGFICCPDSEKDEEPRSGLYPWKMLWLPLVCNAAYPYCVCKPLTAQVLYWIS